MMEAAVKAVLGITVILGGWLMVQTIWRHTTGASPSEDPLAGRLGCHGCDCQSQCKEENGTTNPSSEATA